MRVLTPFVNGTPRSARMRPRAGLAEFLCVSAVDLPAPPWSRAGSLRTARINLPVEPSAAERALLHAVAWDSGRGALQHPFGFNGLPLEVCGNGARDVIHSARGLAPQRLRPANSVKTLSGTDHHDIEILLPGPGPMIRTSTANS